jgi:hypothetical protein
MVQLAGVKARSGVTSTPSRGSSGGPASPIFSMVSLFPPSACGDARLPELPLSGRILVLIRKYMYNSTICRCHWGRKCDKREEKKGGKCEVKKKETEGKQGNLKIVFNAKC